MKIFTLIISAALLSVSFNTCKRNPATADDRPLVDTKWDLQSFEVVGDGKSDIGSEGIYLIFKEDSAFKGRSSTNSYYGTYKISENYSIFISKPRTTKVGYPPGSRYGEYYDALKDAQEFQLMGDRLRIFYESKTKVLHFKAEEP